MVISTHHTSCAWKMPISFLQPAFRLHAVTQELPRLAVEPFHTFLAPSQPLWAKLSCDPYFKPQVVTNTLSLLLGSCLGLNLGFSERLLFSGIYPNSSVLCPGLRDQSGLVGDELERALLMVDLPISKLESLPL